MAALALFTWVRFPLIFTQSSALNRSIAAPDSSLRDLMTAPCLPTMEGICDLPFRPLVLTFSHTEFSSNKVRSCATALATASTSPSTDTKVLLCSKFSFAPVSSCIVRMVNPFGPNTMNLPRSDPSSTSSRASGGGPPAIYKSIKALAAATCSGNPRITKTSSLGSLSMTASDSETIFLMIKPFFPITAGILSPTTTFNSMFLSSMACSRSKISRINSSAKATASSSPVMTQIEESPVLPPIFNLAPLFSVIALITLPSLPMMLATKIPRSIE
mmetsp:Transcript_14888/g.19296  ORF Transcript_14888/g.19296 Transcript_14888/m.19296 type:complete len:273 (-) Transcript_14888:7-825(-)